MPDRSSLLRGGLERAQPVLQSGLQPGAVVEHHKMQPGHRLLGELGIAPSFGLVLLTIIGYIQGLSTPCG